MTLPPGALPATIQLRADTAANWATNNRVLLLGEPGWDSTNGVLKLGDGVTHWASLPVALQGTISAAQALAQAYSDAKAITDVVTTATVSGTAIANKHNPYDATSASLAVTLPSASGNDGALVSIEKTDSTTNTVAITGTIRGVSTTITLFLQNEQIMFVSNGSNSWWPIGSHRTIRTMDSRTGLPFYAPSGLRNSYNAAHNVYNWKPSNTRKIRAGTGRAMLAGGRARHLVVSDSSGAGCIDGVASPQVFDRANAWPQALRQEAARHGISSGGFGIYRMVDGINAPGYWGFTGTWVGSNAYTSSGINGSTLTLTIPTGDPSGDAIDVWYYDAGTATWTVSVNGAVSGTGFLSVTQQNTNVWRKVTLLGLTIVAGSTVVLTKTSATTTIFSSVSVYSAVAGGLVIHNASQSGAKASGTGTTAWGDVTSAGALDPYKKVAGIRRTVTDAVFNGTTTMTSATAAFTQDDVGVQLELATGPHYVPINTYIQSVTNGTTVILSAAAITSISGVTVNIGRDPDCVWISIGGNDHPVSVTPIATIIASVQLIRQQFPNSDCVLVIEEQESPSLILDVNWEAYAAALYTLADTLDVPLVDMRDRIGNFNTGAANGVYGDNQAHLTSMGYRDWGRNVGMLVSA